MASDPILSFGGILMAPFSFYLLRLEMPHLLIGGYLIEAILFFYIVTSANHGFTLTLRKLW